MSALSIIGIILGALWTLIGLVYIVDYLKERTDTKELNWIDIVVFFSCGPLSILILFIWLLIVPIMSFLQSDFFSGLYSKIKPETIADTHRDLVYHLRELEERRKHNKNEAIARRAV